MAAMDVDVNELLEKAPEVKKVQVVRLEPGDIVVLSAPGYISNETANRLKEHFERCFEPEGLKCVVLGDGLEVQKVLRPNKEVEEPT